MENISKKTNCVISRFKSQTSILRIKKINVNEKFSFKRVSVDYIKTIIRNIPSLIFALRVFYHYFLEF